jgi:hypothetical protein
MYTAIKFPSIQNTFLNEKKKQYKIITNSPKQILINSDEDIFFSY